MLQHPIKQLYLCCLLFSTHRHCLLFSGAGLEDYTHIPETTGYPAGTQKFCVLYPDLQLTHRGCQCQFGWIMCNMGHSVSVHLNNTKFDESELLLICPVFMFPIVIHWFVLLLSAGNWHVSAVCLPTPSSWVSVTIPVVFR